MKSKMPYKNIEVKYCKRCGRRLKSPEQIALGYGPKCYEKAQREVKAKKLF